MAKTLSKDDILKLAQLARLELTDAEVAQYQKELSSILTYVSQLEAVDTDGLQPTSQVTGLENASREDQVQEQLASPDALLNVAPQTYDNYIKVGRMV